MHPDIHATSAQLAQFHHSIRLTSIDPSKNRRRFYELRTGHDLFGDPIIARTDGRIGTPGRTRINWYTAPEDAHQDVLAILALRLRHGYQVDQID